MEATSSIRRSMPTPRALRILLIVGLVAAQLTDAWGSPTRTISVPVTLARTLHADGGGASRFAFPATHVAFSWTGPKRTFIAYRPAFSSALIEPWRRAPQVHG